MRVQWTREDDIRHGFYHSTSVDRIEAALDADGKVTGWMHRVVAPSIISTFAPDAGYLAPWRERHGPHRPAFDDPGDPLRERPGDGACAHRLVALGQQRAARLRRAVLRRRARRGARPRPPRAAARADRPARGSSTRQTMGIEGGLWNYGESPEAYPDRHRPARQRARARLRRRRLGADAARGRGHRPRRPPQLRHLRRRGGAGEGRSTAPSPCRRSTSRIDCGFAVNPERIAARWKARRSWG